MSDDATEGRPTGPSHHATRTVVVPGLVLTEHEIAVPLDHTVPDGEQISVFAREVADPDGRDRPFLLFLQGGPGQEADRPSRGPTDPGWLDRALVEFRVLMLDQRGTGRSSPVGRLPGLTPERQAERLTHFRADSIVADAELLRERLGVDRWSVLGQSFGGFCALRYLSAAPGALREVLFTGGLPPVGRPVDDVYRATYATMLGRSRRYYERYPQDRDRVRALHQRAAAGDIVLPNGDRVSSMRLRSVGSGLGMSAGAEGLHYLLERDPDSPAFRHDLAQALPFNGRNPLYVVVHEACYCEAAPPGGRRSALCPKRSPTTSRSSPASTSSLPCSTRTPSWLRCAPRRTCSPSTSGHGCTTPTCWPRSTCRARRRSTPRTPMCPASSRRRPPPCLRPCDRG
jgi:pimeloyl-ACP methyl ester carboxylesterase